MTSGPLPNRGHLVDPPPLPPWLVEKHRVRDQRIAELIANIHRDHDTLVALLDEEPGQRRYEDLIYRFWHQSFKAFDIQNATVALVVALERLKPEGCAFDGWFIQIISEGTGRTFELADNQRWLEVTRPMLEAFWHARFMVEMAVKFSDLDEPTSLLPSGWAALLYIYGLR